MSDHILALLVHDQSETFDSLGRSLRELSVETLSVDTCKKAAATIFDSRPQVVFTQGALPDGGWMTILRITAGTALPPSVIVVEPIPDTRFYLSVMEAGVFDFIAPPFEHESLKFVLDGAVRCSHARRAAGAVAEF